MDPDGPDYPHASDDIDLALAALMKGMRRSQRMIWRLSWMISQCPNQEERMKFLS